MVGRSAYTSVGFIAWKTSSKSSSAAAVARDVRRIVRGTMILVDGWESRTRWFLAQDAVARGLVSTILSAGQAACRADIDAAKLWLEACKLSKSVSDQHDRKAVARAYSLHRRAAAALARAQAAFEQAREANEVLRRHRPREHEIVRLP